MLCAGSKGCDPGAVDSFRALRDVFRNPNLRRLELAWVGSVAGDWSSAVALGVFAYQSGGAPAVGLVGAIRFLPAAVAAPFAAILGDRYRRERVMVASDVVRALAMGSAAFVIFADGPAGIVYGLAGLVSVVSTAFQPAQAALLPSLARSPGELTAANVASSTTESIGSFAGPALGGLLLAATGSGVVFAATAGTFTWSALLVSRIRADRPAGEQAREDVSGLGSEALAGFRTIAVEPRLRLLVGLYAAQTLVAGALNVLLVVCALDLLDMGESGVGFLNSAVGVGGLAGAGLALVLVGRRRLAAGLGVGLVIWGAPIALIGVWPSQAAALILLALVGIGNTIVDVAGLTLLQRAVPDEVLARVFGVLESLVVGTIGLGAIAAPLLVGGLGIEGALIATGAVLPILAVLAWRRLTAIDAATEVPAERIELLRGIPIFAPLPAPVIEHLAGSLEPVRVAAGESVFREGDPGDLFFVVAEGEVEIAAGGHVLAKVGPGGYFGEIALLRDIPRTAGATPRTNGELFSLERDEFIAAVTGHPASAEAADAVIGARLGQLRPGMASL
jgi:MFS family permease